MQDEWVIEDSLYSPDAHLLTSSAVCGRSNAMEICVHLVISGPSTTSTSYCINTHYTII